MVLCVWVKDVKVKDTVSFNVNVNFLKNNVYEAYKFSIIGNIIVKHPSGVIIEFNGDTYAYFEKTHE